MHTPLHRRRRAALWNLSRREDMHRECMLLLPLLRSNRSESKIRVLRLYSYISSKLKWCMYFDPTLNYSNVWFSVAVAP